VPLIQYAMRYSKGAPEIEMNLMKYIYTGLGGLWMLSRLRKYGDTDTSSVG
jgi:hypothetical protein